MSSVFRNLQDFWNKLVRANQAVIEQPTRSFPPRGSGTETSTGSSSHWSAVAKARVQQTQRDLNRAYQNRVANTSSKPFASKFPPAMVDKPSYLVRIQYPSWLSPKTQLPPQPLETEDEVSVTSSKPSIGTVGTLIPKTEDKVSVTSGTVGTTVSETKKTTEEKLQPKYRASSEYRLLPDQIDRVKQSYYDDLKSTKEFNGKKYLFDVEVGRPVFYDEQGGYSVFTSKPTNFQLFSFENSSGMLDTIILPVKDDGTIDSVPATRFLYENKIATDNVWDFLDKVKPMVAFAGFTDMIIPKDVPQLPLTVGNLERGKQIYFNPILNEISTAPSFWKLKVSEDVSQPFEVVPVSDESPAYIVDDNTKKAIEEFVGDVHRMNTSFEYLKEWDTPEDAYSVPAKQSVDVSEALTPYNPLNISDKKREETTVEVFAKDGNLQPLSLEKQVSASNFPSRVGTWLFQALILAGDLPERIFNQDVTVAGQQAKANFFTNLSDALGSSIGQNWRMFVGFVAKAYRDLQMKPFGAMFDAVASFLENFVEDEKEDTFAGSLLRFSKLYSAKTEKGIEVITEFADRMAVLNEYDSVRQNLRKLQLLDDKITYNQLLDHYSTLSQEFPEDLLKNLEVMVDWSGSIFIKQSDGKFVPAKDFFKKSTTYKNMVNEFGQAYVDGVIHVLFRYPRVRNDLLRARELRNNLILGMNELNNASFLVSDLNARSSLRVVNYYNLVSNPEYFRTALQDLANGETTDVPISVIQSMVNRSVLSGQEFSQDQINEILEFLYAEEGGKISNWKFFDVSNRLSKIENPTINDLYLIVRQLEGLYRILAQPVPSGLTVRLPADYGGFTTDEYIEDLKRQSSEVYQDLQSYIVNLGEVATIYRDAGDLEKFKNLSSTSLNILRGSVQFDRLVRGMNGQDVYASWSWDVTPDRYYLFLNNVANSQMQLGRPLTPHEITQLRDVSIDINFILVGQMVADVLNVFDLIQAGKLLSVPLRGLGKVLNTVPFIRTATEAVVKSKFVRFFTDLSIRSAVQKASYEIGEFLVRSMGDKLFEHLAPNSGVYKISDVLSQAVHALVNARKQADSLTMNDEVLDEAYVLFRNSTAALNNFPSYLSEQEIKKFLRSLDVFVDSEIRNLMDEKLISGIVDVDEVAEIVSKSVTKNLDDAIQKTFGQFDEEVKRIVDDALRKGKWQRDFEEQIRKAVAKSLGIPAAQVTQEQIEKFVINNAESVLNFSDNFSSYEDILREILTNRVREDLSKNRMFVHFMFSTSDTFVQYGRNLNRAWGGTTLLWDSFLGTLGRKMPIAKPVFRIVGEAWNLFMGVWVTATLARRPAWVIFNQMENLFRFITLSMFNPTEYKQMIFGLIPDASRAKVLDELGVVPSGIGIDFLPIQTVVDEERFTRFFSGISIASLSESPFKFFSSHYKQNLAKILEQARKDESLLAKILSPYTAFVSSVQSFNQVIEYGMRLRVYHTLLKRQLVKSIPILLRVFQNEVDVVINQFRENLRSDLLANGMSESSVLQIEQKFDSLISSYMSVLVEAIQNNMSDPFRVLSLISEQSSERLRGFITSFASSAYKFDSSFYNKTRSIINSKAEVTNLNTILEVLTSKLQNELFSTKEPFTQEMLDGIFASVRTDLENAYSQMYNFKIRTLFNEAVEETREKFKKSSGASGVEGEPDAPPDTPPKPKGTPKKPKDTPPKKSKKKASKKSEVASPEKSEGEEVLETVNLETPTVEEEVVEFTGIVEESSTTKAGSDYTKNVLKSSKAGESVAVVEFPQQFSGKNSRNPLYNAWKNLDHSIQMATDAIERGEDSVLNRLAGSLRQAFNFSSEKAEPPKVTKVDVPAVEAGKGRRLDEQELRLDLMDKARQDFEENLIARMSKDVNEFVISKFPDYPDIENFTKWSLTDQMEFYRTKIIFPLYASAMRRFLGNPNSLAGDEMFYGILSTALYDMSIGVWNKTALDTYVKHILQGDATLVMIDMRGLHATNNLDIRIGDAVFSGYLVGDAYIQFIADSLKKNSMNVPVFRQGGDEFVLVFPKNASREEIDSMMSKLSDDIANTPVNVDFPFTSPTGEASSVQVSFSGAKIHYGIGSNFDEASQQQNLAKAKWLGGRSADEVREGYHLVPLPSEQQKGGMKVTVTKQGKKSSESSEIERLNKRVAELEKQVAELQKSSRSSLPDDFMEKMNANLEKQNELLSEISRQLKEGNIIVINPNGKNDIQILGRVEEGDVGVVANTVDKVLENQNLVEVVSKEVKKEGEEVLSSSVVNLMEGDALVILKTLDNPLDGWKAVISTVNSSGYVNFDAVHFLLDKTSPDALAEIFEYDSARFLDLIGRVLNQKILSSDISEFYSMVSLLNHLNDEYMKLFRIDLDLGKYQEKTIKFFGDRTFKNQFKKVLEDAQREQRKYLDTLFGDVAQPEIGRMNYAMLRTVLGANLSDRDVRKSISELIQADLSDRFKSEQAITVARDFTELIFRLQFAEDPLEFLMDESGQKFFGNFFNDLLETLTRNASELEGKNFAEIIELYLSELYGQTVAKLISVNGLSDATFDYFINAFEVFIYRMNKQYGGQPFIYALYDILNAQEVLGFEDEFITSNLSQLRSMLGIKGGMEKVQYSVHASGKGMLDILHSVYSKNQPLKTNILQIVGKRIRGKVSSSADDFSKALDEFLNSPDLIYGDASDLLSDLRTFKKTYTTEEGEKLPYTKIRKFVSDSLMPDELNKFAFDNGMLRILFSSSQQIFKDKLIAFVGDYFGKQGFSEKEIKSLTDSIRRLNLYRTVNPSLLSEVSKNFDNVDVTVSYIPKPTFRVLKLTEVEPGKLVSSALRIDSIQSYLGDEVYQSKYFEPFTVRKITSSSGSQIDDLASNFDELEEVAEEVGLSGSVGRVTISDVQETGTTGRVTEFVDVSKLKVGGEGGEAEFPEVAEQVAKQPVEQPAPSPVVPDIVVGEEPEVQVPEALSSRAPVFTPKSPEVEVEELSAEELADRLLKQLQEEVKKLQSEVSRKGVSSHRIDKVSDAIVSDFLDLVFDEGEGLELKQSLLSMDRNVRELLSVELALSYAVRRNDLDLYYLASVIRTKSEGALYNREQFLTITNRFFGFEKDTVKNSKDALKLWYGYLISTNDLERTKNINALRSTLSTLGALSGTDQKVRDEFILDFLKRGVEQNIEIIKEATSIKKPLDLAKEKLSLFDMMDVRLATMRSVNNRILNIFSDQEILKLLSPTVLAKIESNNVLKNNYINFLTRFFETFAKNPDVVITRTLDAVIKNLSEKYSTSLSSDATRELVRTILVNWFTDPIAMIGGSPMSEIPNLRVYEQLKKEILNLISSKELSERLVKTSKQLEGFDSILYTLFANYIKEYLGNPKVNVTTREGIEELVSRVIESSSSLLPFEQQDELVFRAISLDFEIYRLKEMYYSGSQEFKSLVDSVLANMTGVSDKYTDRDIAMAVQEVLDFIEKGDIARFDKHNKDIVEAYKVRRLAEGNLSGVESLSKRLSSGDAEKAIQNFDNHFNNLSKQWLSFEKDERASAGYVTSLNVLKQKTEALRLLFKNQNFVEIAERDPELWKSVREISDLVDTTIDASLSFISMMAETTRQLFPAPLLLGKGDSMASEVVELKQVFALLYNLKSSDEVTAGLAWRDWFGRMEGLNKLFSDYFGRMESALSQLFQVRKGMSVEELKKAISEIRNRSAGLKKILAPPTMKQVIESMGINIGVSKSWRKTQQGVRYVMPAWEIKPIQGVMRTPSGKTVLLQPRNRSHLYYTLEEMFMGNVLDVNDALNLMENRNLFDYAESAFTSWDNVLRIEDAQSPLPISSLKSFLSTTDFSEIESEERRQIYQDLAVKIRQFLYTKDSVATSETQKRLFGEIINKLSQLYYIPTVITRGDQIIPTYDFFVNSIHFGLQQLTNKKLVNPSLRFDTRIKVLRELDSQLSLLKETKNISKLDALFEVTNNLQGQINRGAVLDAIIAALNFRHLSITNQPLSSLRALVGDDVAVVLRGRMMEVLRTQYNMTNRQAKQALNLTQSLLTQLWKLNSGNLRIGEHTIGSDEMWSLIFETFKRDAGIAVNTLNLGEVVYHTPYTKPMHAKAALFDQIFRFLSLRYSNQGLDNVVLNEDFLYALREMINKSMQVVIAKWKVGDKEFMYKFDVMSELRKTYSEDIDTKFLSEAVSDIISTIDEILTSTEFQTRGVSDVVSLGKRTASSKIKAPSVSITAKQLLDRMSLGLHPITVTSTTDGYLLRVVGSILNTKRTDLDITLKAAVTVEEVGDKLDFVVRLSPARKSTQAVQINSEILEEVKALFGRNGFTRLDLDNLYVGGMTSTTFDLTATQQFGMLGEFERATYGLTQFFFDADKRIKAIVTAFDNANVSTFLHEFYHAIEDFIPPMYRYALYDEAFKAVKKRYKSEILDGIETFSQFVTDFQKNVTSDDLFPKYVQIYKEMKEYTVNVFEALILEKTLGKEFVEEGGLGVTSAFSREFKRILVTSYAKFRFRIADARKNKQLLALLDNILFKEKLDTALKLPKVDADTADSIFKTFYSLLNTQKTSTTRSALAQSLSDASQNLTLRKWNKRDVFSFFERNDKFFSVFIQSGRIFNPESFRFVVPEGVFDDVIEMHTFFTDYSIFPLILRYDLFNAKNPYQIYQSMPLQHKTLVDYLITLFHEPSNDYFDSRILSYRISDFLNDVRSDETKFLKEFEKVKSNFGYVSKNFNLLSPNKRLGLLSEILKKANISYINDVDLAGIEFTTQYQSLVKKYVSEVGAENITAKRVSSDLAAGHPVLQEIQRYASEFYNPKFKTFGDKTRYWQARVYMDYLPEDMRKLVELGTPAEVYTKEDTLIGISEVGNLRSILTSDAKTTSHLLQQAPFVYVGKRMSLEFEVDNLYTLLQIEDANDLVEFLVQQDLSKNNLSNRMFLNNYITALDRVPMDKLALITDTYRTVSEDLISKIPPEWYEVSPDIGIGLRLLEQIDKTAEPEKYAKVLSTVRSMALRQMTSTQFTYDRMVSLLDTISVSWWHKVNSLLPAGVRQEDAVHILRKAMAYELRGMSVEEALKTSIRDFLTVQWLSNNIGKIQFKLSGSDKTVTLILDRSSLVSVKDMLRSKFPVSQGEIVGKTLEDLKNSTLDVFYDAPNKIFKSSVLDLGGVLDDVSDAYLVHFASSGIPDRVLRTRIEADFVAFAREVLDESNHYFVRMGDGSYLVLSKDPATQSKMSVLWRNFSSEVIGGSGDKSYPYRISIQRYSVQDLQKQADRLEQRLHNIPYHPTPRTIDEPMSSFELGGVRFSVVTRDTSDPTAFILRKTDGQDGVPVFGIADTSLGESREFSSMSSEVVFNELDIPYTRNDFQRLFNLCKEELGNDNVVAGIMQSWMDFASLVGADLSMSPDPAIISRLSEMYTNLLATGRFVEKRDDFIDYMLTVFALDYKGISRATLPDGTIFHFVPSDLVDVPNSKVWKAKGNARDVLKSNAEADLTKFRLAGMLDSDRYAAEMHRQVGKVTNTPVEHRTLPLELYQAVPSNTPIQNFEWNAFTHAPIFVVERNGRTENVSLRELMNIFSPSDFIYNGIDEFIETMMLMSSKLSEQGVEYAPFTELVNFLIRVAQQFKSRSGTVNLVRPISLMENGIRVPDLNLVFDSQVWRMVSDALFVGFDLESMKTTLNSFESVLRESLSQRPVFFEMERLNNPLNPSPLVQSSDGKNLLTDISNTLAKNLHEMWHVINHGGSAFDGQLAVDEGALSGMNRIMIDYFSTTRADEWMKMIMPFWMYPSRSLPYWLDLISAHPELLSFYAKYREWSDSINWQDGAITSDGKILPSIEGYIPLTVGVYFNPLAPFMYRFVAPNIRDLPETRPPEEMGIFQKLARYMLDIIPQYGFAVSPIVQALAMNFYEPYYPKPSFGYELVRSILPIEWMPPLLEKTLVEYTRKVTHTDMPDMWKPEVSWFDYLVEQEILSVALSKMNSATTEEEKREAAIWARDLILDANRQENPEWKTFEDSLRSGDYWRYMAGNLTGIYTKTLSPLRVDLLQLRSNVNRMKSMINDSAKSAVFEIYDSPNDLYSNYNKFRFETPEGQLYQLYQTTRYVVDPVTKRFATGDDRLRIMLQDAAAEQATQLYYKMIEEENKRYEQELALLRVGDTEGRKKAREKHFENLTKIRTDPALQGARKQKFFSPVKPKDLVYQDVYNDWWFLLVSDEPKYADYETYDAYMRAKEAWLNDIRETAKTLYPIFKTNLLARAYTQNLPEDAIQRLNEAIERVYKETSPNEYEQFRGASKTAIDVVWDAYQKLYVDPFYEVLKGKNGYEYELARELYLQNNPAPDKERIIDWIMEKYPNRFTREELEGVFKNNRPYTIPEREDLTQTQIEKDAKQILRILQNAGNLSSPTFKNFKQIYLSMGGKESDFDVLWATGGDVTRFVNPDKFYEIYNRMILAAKAAGVPEKLTIEELKERIEVQKLNDVFRMNVLRELGEDFYTLMNYYFSLSDKEQAIFRREYKEEFAKIQKYYRMRDEFSTLYPLWATYYNPNFDPTKPSSGGSYGSGGGYSSGGGSYVRSTSPRNVMPRVRQPTSILRMGKRSSMDAMRLFADGILGRGGAEKAPILTEELKSLIGERASAEIENGTADESTAKYLDRLSKARPDKSEDLKALAQAIRRGGDLSYVRTLHKFQ